MFKTYVIETIPARFCPLAEKLGTSHGKNITETKEVTLFPDYFFSYEYDKNKQQTQTAVRHS